MSMSRPTSPELVQAATNIPLPRSPSPPPSHRDDDCGAEEEKGGETQIIVVGAGLTGLCAAYELTKQGHKVLVLERTEYLGGNVRSIKLGNGSVRGQVLDFGPGRIWKSNACIGELLKELHMDKQVKPTLRRTLIHKNRGFSEVLSAPPVIASSSVVAAPISDDDDSDEEEEEKTSASASSSKTTTTTTHHHHPPPLSATSAYTQIDVWAMLTNLAEMPGLGQKLYDLLSKPSTLLSLYRPNADRFGPTQSLNEYLKDQPAAAELFQTFLRGQSYGTGHETPVYLILPLLLRMILRDEYSFEGHTRLLTEALAREIRAKGGEIKCGVRAISVNIGGGRNDDECNFTLDVLSDADDEQYVIPFAHCILACPLGSVMVNGTDVFRESKPVKSGAAAMQQPSYRYTATAQVCVELEHMPRSAASWSHVMEGCTVDPRLHYFDADDLQIVSIANLDATRGLRNCVMLTLATRGEDVSLLNRFFQRTEFVVRAKLQQLLSRMDLFLHHHGDTVTVRDVVHWEVFKCTRPVLNHAMLRKIEDVNARAPQERLWLAGSFASAGPCMETSVYSGRSVALKVGACLSPANVASSTAFEARMQQADQRTMQDIATHVTLNWLAPPCTVAAGALATIGVGALCHHMASSSSAATTTPSAPAPAVVVKPTCHDDKDDTKYPAHAPTSPNKEESDSDDEDEDEDENDGGNSEPDAEDECYANDRACQLRKAELAEKRRQATLYAIRTIRNSFDEED